MQNTYSVAYTRFEVDLDAARDILGYRSRIDLGEVRFHLYQSSQHSYTTLAPTPPGFGGMKLKGVGEKERWLTRASCSGSVPWYACQRERVAVSEKEKVVDWHEVTHPALVETMLSKEHLPEVLANLVSGLSYSRSTSVPLTRDTMRIIIYLASLSSSAWFSIRNSILRPMKNVT